MLYLGVQQEEWDLLLSQMEETFLDLGLGTHILAVYPFGDRLYGLEDSPPGLLCLYCDEAATLLDPTIQEQSSNRKVLTLSNSGSTATYISLFSWCKSLADPDLTDYYSRVHIIPTDMEPLFEDQVITGIMQLARIFLQEHGWCFRNIRRNPKGTDSTPKELIEPLITRSDLILLKTNHYIPGTNSFWSQPRIALRSLKLENILSPTTLAIDDQILEGNLASINREDLAAYRIDLSFATAKIAKPVSLERQAFLAVGQAVKALYLSLL